MYDAFDILAKLAIGAAQHIYLCLERQTNRQFRSG